MADAWAIETLDLVKKYRGVAALDGLSLTVPRGSIYGLLGANGAGKTTALKILMGMVHADSGRARVLGTDVDGGIGGVEVRTHTGFVSEEKDLDNQMTVEEIMRFTAGCYPRWRSELAAEYTKSFELPPDRLVKGLSKGTRTRLALLLALCRGAEVLILDEPTSGLDPSGIEATLQLLVRHVAREEVTVLFSSHQIAEVEQVSDRVGIVLRGRMRLEGDLEDLRQRHRRVQLVFDGPAPATPFRSSGVMRVRREGRTLDVLIAGDEASVLEEARGLAPVAMDVVPVTLKEMFLETSVREEA